jgi:hypothetical protein
MTGQDLSDSYRFAAAKQTGEALGALPVDDPAVVRTILRLLAIEVVHRLNRVPDQLVFDLGPHEHVVGAVQICPALEKRMFAIRRAATSMFAEGWTIVTFLPPSSSTAGVRCCAAA